MQASLQATKKKVKTIILNIEFVLRWVLFSLWIIVTIQEGGFCDEKSNGLYFLFLLLFGCATTEKKLQDDNLKPLSQVELEALYEGGHNYKL